MDSYGTNGTGGANSTNPAEPPNWNSTTLKLPEWVEPIIVFTVLFGAMWLTRKRGYPIFGGRPGPYRSSLDADYARSSDELLAHDPENEDDAQDYTAATKHLPKERKILGFTVRTPNTYRFKNNLHSRVLQKFPFLVEMFYWIINYLFYRMTRVLSQKIFAARGIWPVSEAHGIAILEAEESGWLSFLFPIREHDVQQWFMNGHQDALSVLNRVYALIHIPGTVGFIAWYYGIAPSHPTFATVRRTMTLTNFLAFTVFTIYPCMPPRLLPKEYGFFDTVRHDDAESVWMSGEYVNSLAAMPSMHFGYAFCIGCTLIYHSGIFRKQLEKGERRKNTFWKLFYLLLGIGYPALIIVTIVATANHYFMDALVATCMVVLAFFCNKVFYVLLPLEDWFLWALRAEKPIPSTGERFREVGGRI